jgi:2-iminobutanoate/2-iminopropanoate deaminase
VGRTRKNANFSKRPISNEDYFMKKLLNPQTIHAPLAAYSHQIEVSGEQRWLVLSGQVGMQKDGALPPDPIEQIKQALENIQLNLKAADMGIQDLVKLTIYLVGEIDAAQRRQVLANWLGSHQPCMTLLYVAALAGPALKVEIDAWACADAS